MEKLDDYSGEFLPDLKLSDFSSDALAELLRVYSKLYMVLDGFWYLAVKERLGNEEALACDIQAWEKLCKYEMAKISNFNPDIEVKPLKPLPRKSKDEICCQWEFTSDQRTSARRNVVTT